MKKEKFTMHVAVFLVLKRDGSVLLLRRLNTGHCDGMYSMVAGYVDGDETVARAIIRETREEAGLEIGESDLAVVHTMHYMGHGPEYINLFLTANKWVGEIRNLEPEKCDDLRWFPIDSLPENTIPYIRQAIQCIHNNLPFSEFDARK